MDVAPRRGPRMSSPSNRNNREMDASAAAPSQWRGLRMAAASPLCNVNTANWPADTVAECNAQVSGGMAYNVTYTARRRIQLCGSDACMAIERLMKTDNPSECSYTVKITGTQLLLYADVITPLEQTCRQVTAANVTETTTSSTRRPDTSSSSNDTKVSSPSGASDPDQSIGGAASASRAPESTTTASSKSSVTGAVVAATAGVVVVLLVVIWLFRRKHRQKSQAIAKTDAHSTATTTASSDRSYGDHVDDFAPLLLPVINWKMVSSDITDIKPLTRGSQGAVYLVILDGGRQLASKRLVADRFSKPKLMALIAEAQFMVRLQHPSIVSFAGVAWSSPFDFQVLYEFMPNGDLRSHLDLTKPLQPEPWTRAKLTTALQIAEGLAYLHSFNPPIVHRDLQARNVLLDAKMNAKLSHFSVSQSHSENQTTATGVACSRWLAPELINGGGRYTAHCDIYSFGMMMTEIDTHDVPYHNETMPEITLLHQVAQGTLRSKVSLTCQPEMKALIEGCLSTSVGDRPTALRLTYGLRKMLKETVSE